MWASTTSGGKKGKKAKRDALWLRWCDGSSEGLNTTTFDMSKYGTDTESSWCFMK